MHRKDIGTILMAGMACMLVIYIVLFPNESFVAAKDGLLLWFNVVLPSLLPFFICVEILIGLGIVSFLGSCFRFIMRPIFRIPGEGAFAFFMSIASGYPVGAKITASLYESNICSKAEGQRMLSLCSTSGPLFIIGAVATGILGNPKLGLLLAFAHYLSAISSGMVMRFWGRDKKKEFISVSSQGNKINPLKEMLEFKKRDGRPFGMLMGDAVKNGMNLNLMIGGFIILFSVITAILKSSGILHFLANTLCMLLPFLHLDSQAMSSLIVGILEVTNGIKECAKVSMPEVQRLMLVSFMIGFGGLSINAQVLSVIAKSNFKFGLYCIMKIFQGAAAAFYTYLIFGVAGIQQAFNIYDASNVSQYVRYLSSSFLDRMASSTINMTFALTLMLILVLTVSVKKAKT